MAIINPLAYTIANGNPVDATPVQANFTQIVQNVNANAAPVGGSASQQFFVAPTTNPAGAVPLAQAQQQFAALNGSSSQQFAVANATAASGAVNWSQAGTQVFIPTTSGTITPVAFNTLVAPLFSAGGTITVNPGSFFGQRVRVYGCAYPTTVQTNVSSGSPFLAFPDGSVSYLWVIQNVFHQYIDMVWDTNNWRCTTAGQTVVAPANVSNQAVTLGQANGLYAPIAGNSAQTFAVANATAGNQAVNLGQFSANTATYGWRKVPSANSPTGYFIEQWGRSGDGTTPATSGSSTAVVWNFPIAFPNACLSILANDMGNGCNVIGISAVSTTQAQAWGKSGTNYAVTNFSWFAIGY